MPRRLTKRQQQDLAEQRALTEAFEPLLQQAEREGKWLYNDWYGWLRSPANLRELLAESRFVPPRLEQWAVVSLGEVGRTLLIEKQREAAEAYRKLEMTRTWLARLREEAARAGVE